MDIKIQVLIVIGMISALSVVTNLIRKNRLELRYALMWLLLGVAILILDIFPNLIIFIAQLLGIASPTNMLFFLGFCFSLIIIFILTLTVSRMSTKIKVLAQELALLEKEIERNQEKK